jgi:NAD dependent epimerase/dehydratase family enzyme
MFILTAILNYLGDEILKSLTRKRGDYRMNSNKDYERTNSMLPSLMTLAAGALISLAIKSLTEDPKVKKAVRKTTINATGKLRDMLDRVTQRVESVQDDMVAKDSTGM